MGAAALGDARPAGQPAGGRHPARWPRPPVRRARRVRRLGLLGHRRIDEQLAPSRTQRRATSAAGRSGRARLVDARGSDRGRLLTEIEHDLTIGTTARATAIRASLNSLVPGARSCKDGADGGPTTSLADVLVFVPTPHRDHRGFFTCTFDAARGRRGRRRPGVVPPGLAVALPLGHTARTAHPGGAGRGQARALRPGRDPRRGGGRPPRVAHVRPARDLSARRRAVPGTCTSLLACRTASRC